jgi:hypothetical protein
MLGLMAKHPVLAPTSEIARRIIVVRGQKAMIDADLAQLYGVSTKRLNEQVRRNEGRFAGDEFVFQLTAAERLEVVANCDHLARLKFSPTLPFSSVNCSRHTRISPASSPIWNVNTLLTIRLSPASSRRFVK